MFKFITPAKNTQVSFRSLIQFGSIAFCSAFSGVTMAAVDTQWWFDVEVIVYKRDVTPNEVSEQFPAELVHPNTANSYALLMDYIQPNPDIVRQHLPVCFAEPIIPETPKLPTVLDSSLFETIEYEPLQLASLPDQPVTETNDEQEIDLTQNTAEALNVAEQSLLEVKDINESVEENQLAPIQLSVELPNWEPLVFLDNYACVYMPQEHRLPFVAKVPEKIDGGKWVASSQPQLLALSDLQLNQLAKDIGRQRGLTNLIHMGWRQQIVFGQDKAIPLHLFAGKNYAKEYAQDGKRIKTVQPDVYVLEAPTPISSVDNSVDSDLVNDLSSNQSTDEITEAPSTNDLLNRIDAALNGLTVDDEAQSITDVEQDLQEQQKADYLWELDGNLKVFLRYIQKTPYLHIDGNLDFRAPVFDIPLYLRELNTGNTVLSDVLPDRLQSFPFSQLRRVISTQVHYFDHPMFGLIVQIRRFDFPEQTESEKVK